MLRLFPALTLLCYAVLYWLLNHIEGHRLSLFDGLHTISAAAFGYIIFKESITPAMLLGGTLLLAALVIGKQPPSKMV